MLDEQLQLLAAKRGEVEVLRKREGRADEDLADDLAGIRLVLSAALLSQGLDEAERGELERREREARGLLTAATRPGATQRASVRRL